MKILGIDFSLTYTGLCLLDTETNHFKLTSLRPKMKGDERIMWFKTMFTALIKNTLPDLVTIEDYAFSGNNLASIGECVGILKIILNTYKISYKMVPPGTLKKWGFAKGNQPKDTMYAHHFHTRWSGKQWGDFNPERFPSDNHIDAFLLATVGASLMDRDYKSLNKYEIGILDSINAPKTKAKKKR